MQILKLQSVFIISSGIFIRFKRLFQRIQHKKLGVYSHKREARPSHRLPLAHIVAKEEVLPSNVACNTRGNKRMKEGYTEPKY